MGMQTGNGGALQSEINVTPLVDVVLVLLIIFMVIVPLTLRGYDVDVPTKVPAVSSDDPRPDPLVLGIAVRDCPQTEPMAGAGLPEACRVRLNDEPTSIDALPALLDQALAGRETDDRVLLLDVEDRVNYEAVLRILDRAHTGVEGLRIGLMTGV